MDATRDKAIEDRWRFGHCYPMAVALADEMGWTVEALVVEWLPSRDRGVWETHVVHAWAVDGDGNAFDAGGPMDRAETRELMLGEGNCRRTWRDDRVEAFDTAEEFVERLAEAAGGFADEARTFMAALSDEAAAVARDYVVPVHLGNATPSAARARP